MNNPHLKADNFILSALSKQGLTIEQLARETRFPLFYLRDRLKELHENGRVCSKKDVYYVPKTEFYDILLAFLILLLPFLMGVNIL